MNTSNTFITTISMFLSAKSHTCVRLESVLIDWLFSFFNVWHLLCMSGNVWLDGTHCAFYLFLMLYNLFSYKHSWPSSYSTVNLVGKSLIPLGRLLRFDRWAWLSIYFRTRDCPVPSQDTSEHLNAQRTIKPVEVETNKWSYL